MNALPRAAVIAASLALLPLPSQAVPTLVEKFDGNKLNPNIWVVTDFRKARMFPKGGRLHFILNKPSRKESYSIADTLNFFPTVAEDWEVIVDVKNKIVQGASGKKPVAAPGIWISSLDETENVLYFEFYGRGAGKRGGFEASFQRPNGNFLHPPLSKNFPRGRRGEVGALRVVFLKNKQLFVFWCKPGSRDSAQRWRKVGTFSITGKGGDQRLNWNMDPVHGRFLVRLGAFAEKKTKVGRGKISFDNYILRNIE